MSSHKNDATSTGGAAVSRLQILDAAARLFRDQGYAATTLRQIAKAAKMKAGSIYYHFSSKDEILHAVLDIGERAAMTAVKQRLEALPEGASGRARIEAAIEGHLAALLEQSLYWSANIRVFGQLPDHIKRRHRRQRDEYARLWDDLFFEARKAGEIRSNISVAPLRRFVLGALNWTVEWIDVENGSVDELSKRISLFIFEGIERKADRLRVIEGDLPITDKASPRRAAASTGR